LSGLIRGRENDRALVQARDPSTSQEGVLVSYYVGAMLILEEGSPTQEGRRGESLAWQRAAMEFKGIILYKRVKRETGEKRLRGHRRAFLAESGQVRGGGRVL